MTDMHLRIIKFLAVILLACTQALAITLAAAGADDGVTHPSSALQLRDTRIDITAHLDPRAIVSFSSGNGAVEAAVIGASVFATVTFCAATGGIGCVAAAAFAVAVNFLSFAALMGRTIHDQPNVFLLLPPTPQKSHIERLTTELEPAVWHTIGHTHVNGFNHTLHFFNGGSFKKLRAHQVPFLAAAAPQKRADITDNDGAVVDYTWQNENSQPFNNFPRSQDVVNTLATDLVNYMLSQRVLAACSDFADPNGFLASGMLSIGVNNQPFDYNTLGGVQNAFSFCRSNGL